MLNPDKLKNQIKAGISKYIVPSIEQMEQARHPVKSSDNEQLSKNVAQIFEDMVAEPLAETLATTIDQYIKSAEISGTIITAGPPTTHWATIISLPYYPLNGVVPNTLGIQ